MYLHRDWGNIVDSCSGLYTAGQWAGHLWGTVALPASGFNAGASSVFYNGRGALEAAQLGKGAGKILSDTTGGKILAAIDAHARCRRPSGVWPRRSSPSTLRAQCRSFLGHLAGQYGQLLKAKSSISLVGILPR